MRRVALALIVVLVAGACSSTGKKQSTISDDTSSGTTAAASSGPGGAKGPAGGKSSGRGSVGGSAPGSSGAGSAGRSSRGAATAVPVGGTIKVGMVIDTGNPGAAFGVDASQDEHTADYAKALVADMNSHGGLGGRKIQLFIAKVDTTDQSSATQTRLHNEACTSLTEDKKVFVVVIAALNSFYGFGCYASHHTPALPGDPFSDDADLRQFLPWVLPGLGPNFTRVAGYFPAALKAQRYMTNKMAVITYDTPGTRRAVKTLISNIGKQGGKVIDSVYVPVTYEGLASSIASAALRFQQNGVDRVVAFPASGAWFVFTKQAESQRYRPRYALTSYDTPQSYIDQLPDGARVPPEQLKDAVGIGWEPGSDVPDPVYPPTRNEKACWAVINKRTGSNFSGRDTENSGSPALSLCGLFWVLRAALAPTATTQLRQVDVIKYMTALGSSWEPLSVPRSYFAPGRVDGAAVYRYLAYDAGKDRFTYTSGWLDVPR